VEKSEGWLIEILQKKKKMDLGTVWGIICSLKCNPIPLSLFPVEKFPLLTKHKQVVFNWQHLCVVCC
jgi:hypothetical protein